MLRAIKRWFFPRSDVAPLDTLEKISRALTIGLVLREGIAQSFPASETKVGYLIDWRNTRWEVESVKPYRDFWDRALRYKIVMRQTPDAWEVARTIREVAWSNPNALMKRFVYARDYWRPEMLNPWFVRVVKDLTELGAIPICHQQSQTLGRGVVVVDVSLSRDMKVFFQTLIQIVENSQMDGDRTAAIIKAVQEADPEKELIVVGIIATERDNGVVYEVQTLKVTVPQTQAFSASIESN